MTSNAINAREMAEKNRNDLSSVSNTKEELKELISDRITKRTDAVEARIRQIADEKEELCRSTITRAELLENAITAFRKQRARYLQEVIARHLQSCRKAGLEPFNDVQMRLDIFNDWYAWGVFFLAASETDVKEAVKLLPEEGLSMKERDARIKVFDDEIRDLHAGLKKELERVRAEQ